MVRNSLVLTISICILFGSNLYAEQIDSVWIGGEDGFWNDADDWSPAIVPDNNETQEFGVTIDGGTASAEIDFARDITVNTMDCYNNVELESLQDWSELTLSQAQGLTNYGYLDIEKISIIGNITNTAGANLELESMGAEIEGNLSNNAGGVVTLEGFTEFADGDIVNSGTMTFYHNANLRSMDENCGIENNGTFNFKGGVCRDFNEIVNNTTGTIAGMGVLGAAHSMENKGLIVAYMGDLLVSSYGTMVNKGNMINLTGSTLNIFVNNNDFLNQGNINVRIGGAVSYTSSPGTVHSFINDSNGTVSLRGGTIGAPKIVQKAGAAFSGFGGIFGNLELDPDAAVQITGPTNIVGNVTVPAGAVLEISDGQTLVTGYTTNNGTIHMKGGRLIPQGGLTNNGQILWEPGQYNNIADFNLDGSVNFSDFAEFSNSWLWQTQW
ncbi:MAG: hypothetical protein WC496_01580 [Phycisphaerae bacterium]|jgi:hypothetical protein